MNISYLIDLDYNQIVIGIVFGIGAIGLGLIYKYLKFPDFTTTASISAGAITMAVLSETNIILGFIGSISIGLLLGLLTFSQIKYIKIPPILAGIITWIGALSIMFIITGNQATISSSKTVIKTFNIIIHTKDSIWNLLVIVSLAVFICYSISKLFKTRFGLYILAMLGTENYLNHRHKQKNTAQFILLVFGNGLISFAGAFLTVINNSANIKGTPEFLVIALSGFVFANFLILLFSGSNSQKYLQKDNKPSGNIVFKVFLIIQDKLKLNDEEPLKIFIFLLFIVLGSTIVQFIFQYIDTNYSGDQSKTHLYKAGIFFALLSLMRIYELLTKYESSK